jgi:hypothetical protein
LRLCFFAPSRLWAGGWICVICVICGQIGRVGGSVPSVSLWLFDLRIWRIG